MLLRNNNTSAGTLSVRIIEGQLSKLMGSSLSRNLNHSARSTDGSITRAIIETATLRGIWSSGCTKRSNFHIVRVAPAYSLMIREKEFNSHKLSLEI